jgi:hypothetical protein
MSARKRTPVDGMTRTKRQHTLGIWALALGYFLFYIPYSGLTKAVTSGLLSGGQPVSGFALLPSTVVSTACLMLLFITLMGWWKHARKRMLWRHDVVAPSLQTLISGLGFAAIIIATTLAYSFSGVSILFALILMRSGVLIMSPLIDRMFQRRVRWFSWAGLVLSLAAVVIAFANVKDYQLSLAALLNLALYLTGYAVRLPCMTQMAKTGQKETALGYFVEEQLVAMPALVLAPALFAALGHGAVAAGIRFGFTHLLSAPFTVPGLAIGFFYAGLGTFCTFIYLDRRENTFCIPMFACSSLLSGIVASYALTWWFHAPYPSGVQMSSACLIMAALFVLSPLHHLPMYLKELRNALGERRLVLVDFVKPAAGSPPGPRETPSVITVNFQAVREVLQKRRAGGRS